MVYTEVVILKSRKGKTLESVRDAFDEFQVKEGKVVVRNMKGRVIIYDFSCNIATFWRPGNPGDRRKANIEFINLQD